MEQASDKLAYLFHRYYHQTVTAEEEDELMALLAEDGHEGLLEILLQEAWEAGDNKGPFFDREKSDAILQRVLQPAQPLPVRKLPVIRRWLAAAAVILLLIAAGTYFWNSRQTTQPPLVQKPAVQPAQDVSPGSNKAVLVIANGHRIQLDNIADTLLEKDGAAISNRNGQLTYHTGKEPIAVPLYNKVIIPRGGQYKLVLPDGSKVWLNAASSLRYPVAFTSGSREVELSGEAYFEVAHDNTRPFRIRVRKAMVQVLGTHFNIMAYDDEIFTTTLLEGSVRVINGGQQALLRPGQQARLGTGITVNETDAEDAVAWKNGLFSFRQTDLAGAMRQMARWYNVEVVFEGKVPARRLTGFVPRGSNISQVLKMLEFTAGIHYRIEGDKITLYQ